MLTWLIGLLSEEAQRVLGESMYPAGYHMYLCGCCDD